jgi:hypothetical protein
MKKLLYQILFFITSIFVYLIGVFIYNYYFENSPQIQKSNIIVIGDSHARYGVITDSFLNSNNYCSNADNLIMSKWKLQHILPTEQIDTVFISLGYHSFTEDYKNFFSSNDAVIPKVLERYLFISDGELFNYELDYRKLVSVLGTKIKKPYRELEYLGVFVRSDEKMSKPDTSKAAWRANTHFKSAAGITFDAASQIRNILNICDKNGVICYFIFPPVTNDYKKRIPKRVIASTDSFLNILNARGLFLPTIQTLPDFCFFDPDHLNYEGAKIYTHSLKQALYNKKKRPKTNL